MKKIAIVTDSTCDLSPERVKKYDIRVIPLQILYKDRIFRDGVDIDSAYVCDHLSEEIPKSSLPLTADMVRTLDKLIEEEYTHVLMIHLSSGLSGTYNMIRQMIKEYEDRLVIHLMDSKLLSMPLGAVVLEAAITLAETGDFDQTVARAQYVRQRSKGYFTVKNLVYLKKGGRISRFEGAFGSLLDVKPIIGISEEDGSYYVEEKVRGRKKSISKLIQLAKGHIEGKKNPKIYPVQFQAEEEAQMIFEAFAKPGDKKEDYIVNLGPLLLAHAGPGMVGLCVTWED